MRPPRADSSASCTTSVCQERRMKKRTTSSSIGKKHKRREQTSPTATCEYELRSHPHLFIATLMHIHHVVPTTGTASSSSEILLTLLTNASAHPSSPVVGGASACKPFAPLRFSVPYWISLRRRLSRPPRSAPPALPSCRPCSIGSASGLLFSRAACRGGALAQPVRATSSKLPRWRFPLDAPCGDIRG